MADANSEAVVSARVEHVRLAERVPDSVATPALDVVGLSVAAETARGTVYPVREATWRVAAGETLCIVGETGSGKSMTLMAVLGLLPPHTAVAGGSVRLSGQDLLALPMKDRRKLLGRELTAVFQDPNTSLDPVMKIGVQLDEARAEHFSEGRADRRVRVSNALRTVGVADTGRIEGAYPHELSGGLKQRVLLAMAILNEPRVILADEPTTALDVTVQAQVLDALSNARRVTGAAVVLVTHDLGVVAEVADHVAVMYAGRIVEHGPVRQIFSEPRHPYTFGLLSSLPRVDRPVERLGVVPGYPPSVSDIPSGCPFHPRCFRAGPGCNELDPELIADGPLHGSACHYPLRRGESGQLLRGGLSSQAASDDKDMQ